MGGGHFIQWRRKLKGNEPSVRATKPKAGWRGENNVD